VSCEAGINELGGHPLLLRPDEKQLTRGESVRDTAHELSRHEAAIGLRTGSDERLEELARHADVPVVNMLSPRHHPCQALADLLTLREAFGALAGRVLAYVGDGNNVARSLAVLGGLVGVEVRVASPAGFGLEDGLGAVLTDDPDAAVAGADVVYTDVWVSMSDHPDEAAERRERLAPYRLDSELLDRAAPHAFALHCLPAHPGEEITEDVLYGDAQRIWDQAENRRHAQKALLEQLVSTVSPRASEG
jgi:ornithine carbamoyltransferase